MTKVKKCADCLWRITKEDVAEILRNYSYEQGDPDYPEVGCGLGTSERDRYERGYYCKEHSYPEGILETFIIKDEKYLGPGYFVISEVNGQVAKYFKIYLAKENECEDIRIQAYEADLDLEDEDFKFINFTVSKLNELHRPVEDLVLALSNQAAQTINPNEDGRSQMIGIAGDFEASLIISRDDYGQKRKGEDINLSVGAYGQSQHWDAFNNFYQSLEEISLRREAKKDSNKVLRKEF